LLTSSSSLALPSGFSTDVSKSNRTLGSEGHLPLVATGARPVPAAAAGAELPAPGPVQQQEPGRFSTGFQRAIAVASAVAGVQYSGYPADFVVPFFSRCPRRDSQLSTALACAADSELLAHGFKERRHLSVFFMILLSREGAV